VVEVEDMLQVLVSLEVLVEVEVEEIAHLKQEG
jgi:hypothetical protein